MEDGLSDTDNERYLGTKKEDTGTERKIMLQRYRSAIGV